MKRRKLKPVVKKALIASCLCILFVLSIVLLNGANSKSSVKDNFVYVNDSAYENYSPVVKEEEKIINPFDNENVTVLRNYYNKDASSEEQQKSIIYHEGVYMQNSGIDYSSKEEFDVLSIISGTVNNIIEDSLLGNSVEVKVSNELTIMYQSLKNINVKKGDTISQGDIIAKSGSCVINDKVENGLHIEVYKNGTVINPTEIFGKTIKEIIKE